MKLWSRSLSEPGISPAVAIIGNGIKKNSQLICPSVVLQRRVWRYQLQWGLGEVWALQSSLDFLFPSFAGNG
jgi:hypothetical protein